MLKSLTCENCGNETLRTGPTQRYCPACSRLRRLRTAREWAADHQQEQYAKNGAMHRYASRKSHEAGKLNSERTPIAWEAGREIDLAWMVRVSVPFSYALSKNALLGKSASRMYRRDASKAAQEALTLTLRAAVQGHDIVQNRVWIDIFVQKPDHRGDAANVVDVVCDAVKVAIGLDDRWFSIRRLDWEIVKGNPRLYVGVGQENGENMGICSTCGRMLPACDFNRHRSGATSRLGIARVCRECRRDGRRIAREERQEAGLSR